MFELKEVQKIFDRAFKDYYDNIREKKNIITAKEEVITDQQLEKMVNEAYNKFKTRTMNNSK